MEELEVDEEEAEAGESDAGGTGLQRMLPIGKREGRRPSQEDRRGGRRGGGDEGGVLVRGAVGDRQQGPARRAGVADPPGPDETRGREQAAEEQEEQGPSRQRSRRPCDRRRPRERR